MTNNLGLEEIDLVKKMLRGEISKTSESKIDINKIRSKMKFEDYARFYEEIPPFKIDNKKFDQVIDKYSNEINKTFAKLTKYYSFMEENPKLAKIYNDCHKRLKKSKLIPVNIEDDLNLKTIFSRIYFNPNETNSWINQAFIFERFNRYDLAIICFENAFILDQSDFIIWVYISEGYEKIKEYDKSISCIKKAIEASPNNSELWIKKWEIANRKLRYYKFGIHTMLKTIEGDDISAFAKMTMNIMSSLVMTPLKIFYRQENLMEKDIKICKNCKMRYRNMLGLVYDLCPICSSVKIQHKRENVKTNKAHLYPVLN